MATQQWVVTVSLPNLIGKRKRKVSRMATNFNVERIDIIEGPRLEDLLMHMALVVAFRERGTSLRSDDIQVSFDEVRYYDDEGHDVGELLAGAVSFRGTLVAISFLGRDPSKAPNFVIAMKSGLGIFEGHYNVQTRKGCLVHVK